MRARAFSYEIDTKASGLLDFLAQLVMVFSFCIEVWVEVKCGVVRHSPTNKEPPKHGPWSPVSLSKYALIFVGILIYMALHPLETLSSICIPLNVSPLIILECMNTMVFP